MVASKTTGTTESPPEVVGICTFVQFIMYGHDFEVIEN